MSEKEGSPAHSASVEGHQSIRRRDGSKREASRQSLHWAPVEGQGRARDQIKGMLVCIEKWSLVSWELAPECMAQAFDSEALPELACGRHALGLAFVVYSCPVLEGGVFPAWGAFSCILLTPSEPSG